MTRVSATEFKNNIGAFSDAAMNEPVIITSHQRDRLGAVFRSMEDGLFILSPAGQVTLHHAERRRKRRDIPADPEHLAAAHEDVAGVAGLGGEDLDVPKQREHALRGLRRRQGGRDNSASEPYIERRNARPRAPAGRPEI